VLSSDSEGYVVNWFEAARERFAGPGQFPLIDDREIVEEKAVYERWPSFLGSERDVDGLRQEALAVDHLDLPVRFVYLNHTITKFRNREDHADQHSITMSDAQIMSKACRRLINLLHPRT
jgi:hypothetical protein